jgi:uncharacterized 2Fe-2S/4Fe-4S cluster protein (DUF4445 family)
MSPESLAFILPLRVDPPSPSDKTADIDRLIRTLETVGYNAVEIPIGIARILPAALRRNNFELEMLLGLQDGHGPFSGQKRRYKLLDVSQKRALGLALDIGSSNIECSLFDLGSGERKDAGGSGNPQMKFGADVLSRVQHAMLGESGSLTETLIAGINRLIEDLCRRNAISGDDIVAVAVAGNTIMSHFFLGLDVTNIPVSPYTPAMNCSVIVSAGEIGLSINRNAVVYIFPNSGSYVGGDIISGMVYSGLFREEEPVLLVDVGTNVEITLGCRDWIMVGAGAAGPALEDGIAAIGKKAQRGTISKVRIDREGGRVHLDVIDDIEPQGICGSGMIDLIAELYATGIIDQRGRFVGEGNGVEERDGRKAYLLYNNGTKELSLTEEEIQNFLLSKAAMFSFLYVFVKSVGLTFSDIKKIYIAGALGCGIDPENAIRIGMLPDIPRDRFIPLGNSSLGGAEMVLLNRNLLPEVEEIAGKITYREMNEDNELMKVLQGAMFIPHTDPDLLRG